MVVLLKVCLVSVGVVNWTRTAHKRFFLLHGCVYWLLQTSVRTVVVEFSLKLPHGQFDAS